MYFAPWLEDRPNYERVFIDIEDFYGSDEQTLYVVADVLVGSSYECVEIEQTFIMDGDKKKDVWMFLTPAQKHDIKMAAWAELQPNPNF